MEFIWILVVVIVLFNLLNGLGRREKARQAQLLGRPAHPPGSPEYPDADSTPSADYTNYPVPPPLRSGRPEPPHIYRPVRPKPAPEPAWAGEGKTLMWHEDDPGPLAGGKEPEPAHGGVGHDSDIAPENEAAMPDLINMLRHKDRLVEGFIFHEILERPRSLRRR